MLNRNKLVAAMAEHGFNQRQLAQRVGISENTLSAKMNGKAFFNTEEIENICRELDIADYARRAEIFLANSSQ